MMVRLSNFLVFFMALIMTHEITLYLSNLLQNEGGMSTPPRRLLICETLFVAGVILLIVSQFTGLYYFFDETNTYHRGPGSIICFVIPILIAFVQLSALIRYRRKISYLGDSLQGDLPNLQIDGWRTVSTPGIPVTDSLQLTFRTKSLPFARLVWHCPFICLFTSADRQVNGKDYRELALIRLDGENWHTDDRVSNNTSVVMTPAFPGWDEWKRCLKAGIACSITLTRKENCVILQTENLGISISSEITVREPGGEICAALTGDQCVITEIRIAK